MRITEKIVKAGSFWLPGDQKNEVPGEIKILEGGKIKLAVLSVLGGAGSSTSGIQVGRVLGSVEGFGYVTLEGCFYTTLSHTFGDSKSKSILTVNRMFAGVGYADEIVQSSTLDFSVEGLDEWVGITGIKVERDEDTYRDVKISYEPVPAIFVQLTDDIQLKILFSWALPGFPIQREAKITQKISMQLMSSKEEKVSDLTALAYKVVTFICMGVDAVVSIENPSITYVSPKDGQGEHRRHAVQVFYSSLPYSSVPPEVTWHELVFGYKYLGDKFGERLKKWIDCFERIGPSIDLYFSVKTGVYRYLDAKFLALAQGLESLHRRTRKGNVLPKSEYKAKRNKIVDSCPDEYKEWLALKLAYANEFPLSHRMKELVTPFSDIFSEGSPDGYEIFIRAIVDTRNFHTHFDESGKRFIARGVQLASLVNRMELLLQLHLLYEMGFDAAELVKIFNKNFRMKQKLDRRFESTWVNFE